MGGGSWAVSFQLHLCTAAREMRVRVWVEFILRELVSPQLE